MLLGPNRSLIGKPITTENFATPALLVDRSALESNIATMAGLAARHKIKLRPHGKAHKSSRVGRMQIEAGAVGICCATVREVEVMAAAGLPGILLTTPIVTPSLIERVVHAREKIATLTVVVDNEFEVDLLAEYARQMRPIDVLVDVDMGLGRTGVRDSENALRLAQKISGIGALRYRGVQAYYGHLQHVPRLVDRHVKIAEQWRHLEVILEVLKQTGFPAETISGGGTGTHNLDLAHGPFTELQPGSYLFMDKQYEAVEIAPGGSPFRTALTVASRVVSTIQADRVIVDAGSKALSTDAGPASIASGAPEGAVYQFMGDEHGAITLVNKNSRPELGDLITFISPHCDPTVNLYDEFHIVDAGHLVDIWPIEARGH